MIKRLAHRNANVQLYTLEVRDFFCVPRDAYMVSDYLLTVIACQRLVAKLWTKDSSRAGLEKLY